jgi:hypothetical protein
MLTKQQIDASPSASPSVSVSVAAPCFGAALARPQAWILDLYQLVVKGIRSGPGANAGPIAELAARLLWETR